MKYTLVAYLIFVLITVISCRKPYLPPVITAPNSYLVVEGVINSGTDSTIIKLSKTANLLAKVTTNPVRNAELKVEGNNGTTYALNETTPGKYVSGSLNLNNNKKYRLRIKTPDNEEFLSDFVGVVNSPAIDTVSYSFQSNGIQMNLGTHDPQNSTHYYRWEYQETWVIHSTYYSFYKSNGDSVINRNFINDEVYQCWRSDTSSAIVLGSSAALSKDVISDLPFTFIPSTSEKLDGGNSIILSQHAPAANAYSILVKQYALTSDAYAFWTNLKRAPNN